jgi:hypothetical protein
MKAARARGCINSSASTTLLAGASHSAVARTMPAVNRSIFEWLRPHPWEAEPRFLNLYADAAWDSNILMININSLYIKYKVIRERRPLQNR